MDLLQQVQTQLATLSPSDLRRISEDVAGVSFSWLSQIARGKYQSEPAYSRLRAVSDWLAREQVAPPKKPRAKAEA